MIPQQYFDDFKARLLELPIKSEGTERYEEHELKRDEFLLFSESGLDVYYAPFHAFNPSARIVLVGLTPGWTQMEEAFRAARHGLSLQMDGDELYAHIDRVGSFSGSLRTNLVSMLNEIGVAEALQLSSSNELFSDRRQSASFTSVVSAPIFLNGRNFNGSARRLFRSPRIEEWILGNLASELNSATRALIIPLGTTANAVVEKVADRRVANLHERVLKGFPHPSGANGHRKTIFQRGKIRWSEQVKAHFQHLIVPD